MPALGAPGFGQMGIGQLGQPDKIFKRKFRFTFAIYTDCPVNAGVVPEWFVKSMSRPQLDIDEVELNFLNGVTWIPGKGRWQPITVTYIDAADQLMQDLYNWLATVYDFTDPVRLHQSEKPGWKARGVIRMWDGCGTLIETWILDNMWPQSINFGDLDYSNSEEATLELTLRYSDVFFIPECGVAGISPCCVGCTPLVGPRRSARDL